MAGNFGFERQHYELSMKVAENALAPELRGTDADMAVLADGFSCAMQVRQLDDQRLRYPADFPLRRARSASSLETASNRSARVAAFFFFRRLGSKPLGSAEP